MIIAIDGPAGSGKSSVAKEIAKRIGYTYLDTGAMYRMYAYKVKKENIEYKNIEDILEIFDFKITKDMRYYVDGEEVTDKIRKADITDISSRIVSVNKKIRKYMVEKQREIAGQENIVIDGRDIGTVVFPNADIKIFLTAKAEERAKRRQLEDIKKGINTSYEEILDSIKRRDYDDSTRTESPLKQAEDAILLDTTNISIEEVIEKIINIVKYGRK